MLIAQTAIDEAAVVGAAFALTGVATLALAGASVGGALM